MPDERAPALILRTADTGPDDPSDFKLVGAQTAGTMSLLEFGLTAWQSGPDLHRHAGSDETFYVLDGAIEFEVDGARHVLERGDVAWVPRGTAHTFANAGRSAARALTVATPAGLEDFFADQSAYLADCARNGHQPDADELAALRRRHGGERLGPPIRAGAAPSDAVDGRASSG